RVTVTDNGFHVRTGLWGLTAVHEVPFNNLRVLRLTSETTTSKGVPTTKYYFVCDMKNGETVRVPVVNEVTKAAAETILRRVAAYGVPIEGEKYGTRTF